MANYTVKDVRAVIEDLDDSTPLFGFIIGPKDLDVWGKNEANDFETSEESGYGYRNPNAEEWAKIVANADNVTTNANHSVWDAMWSILNEAAGGVCVVDE